jgi:hypothetical protein
MLVVKRLSVAGRKGGGQNPERIRYFPSVKNQRKKNVAKTQDSKKQTKKAPAMTPKEKKAAKRAKKGK